MIKLPDELYEQIKKFCKDNNLGMTVLPQDHIYSITIGHLDLGENGSLLIAAYNQLGAVLLNMMAGSEAIGLAKIEPANKLVL